VNFMTAPATKVVAGAVLFVGAWHNGGNGGGRHGADEKEGRHAEVAAVGG
jgi:hypothetical protein